MKTRSHKQIATKPYDNSRDEVRLVCERGYVVSFNETTWIFCFTRKSYEARTMSGTEANRLIAADAVHSRHNFRIETVSFLKF